MILSCLFLTTLSLGAENIMYRLTHLDGFSSNHQKRLEQIRQFSKDFETLYPFEPSDIPIDILIPTVEKDLEMIPHTIAFAKKNLLHPILHIYIVAPPTPKIISLAQELGCIFVDENTVLPIKMKDIHYFPSECGGCDRRGWLFQQFLKLSCDTICEAEHVLVIDTDTLLIRPQTYTYKGRTIFQCSDEYHQPYRDVYKKLIGEAAKGPFSFVSHTTLFEKSKLRHFKQHIENLHHRPWFQAVMDLMDKNQASAFAENESYPQFVVSFYPDSFIQLYFFNDSTFVRKRDLAPILEGKGNFNPYTKSISFHSYNSY